MNLCCPLCKQPVEQESTINELRAKLEALQQQLDDMIREHDTLSSWVSQQLGQKSDDQH